MTPQERVRLVDLVAGRVSKKRLAHTLRVETLAVRLARFWGVSQEKASVASLLHDIARDEPQSSLLELVKDTDDPLTREMAETSAPLVLHAPVGALIARRDFDVRDPEILRAIALHTTGAPHMDSLAMIVFLADYCESGRRFAGVGEVRSLLFSNLEAAMLRALSQTVAYLRQHSRAMDRHTVDATAAFARLAREDSQPLHSA
ncbi:MAG: bis(5'-nucleosyl)-tetraphosphatase (symmetrical) YqeK [Caldiserica bacterium]|nr:bis(5'-nucleosyl)-tetraphosphatase (symmetrical) YqeK [Caldisericota bacterium]